MTILTHKMKTQRMDDEFPAAQVFFPCDDGSGNSISCVVTEASVSDTGTANHNTPHAVELLSVANATAAWLGAAILGKKGIALAVYEQAAAVAALCTQKMGGNTVAIILNATTTGITTSAGSSTTGATGGNAAQGDILGTAIAWDESNIYTYYGEDADLALVDTDELSETNKSELASGVFLNDSATIQQSTRGALYGWLILSFNNSELPNAADRLLGLNWMKDHWLVGDKSIFPAWSELR